MNNRHVPVLAVLMAAAGGVAHSAFNPGDIARPEVVVPVLEQSPNVAEGIGSTAWAKAAKLFGFTRIANGMPAVHHTELWLARDDQALYAAFVCHLPSGVKPRAEKKGRDIAVWEDDSVEFYLAMPDAKDDKDYWQFSVSAGGATWDGKCAKVTWNGDWQASAKVEDGRWHAVMRIPFKSLELSVPLPPTLRFAASRTVISPDTEQQSLIHVSPTAFFDVPEKMGLLTLAANTPAVSLTAKGNFSEGDVSLVAEGLVLPPDKYADSSLTLIGKDGKVVAIDTQQARFDSRSVTHNIRGLPNGEYKLRYTYGKAVKIIPAAYYGGGGEIPNGPADVAEREKTRVFLIEWPLSVQVTLAVKPIVKLKDCGQTLSLTLETTGKVGNPDLLRYVVSVQSLAGEKLADIGATPFKSGALFESPLPKLQELTKYNLRIAVMEGDNLVTQQLATFATPAEPRWLGTKEGEIDGVPEPWTPVQLSGRTAEVWGRKYTFNDGPAPSSVVSQEKELLASPCRIELDPRPSDWKLVSSRTEGKGPATAVFQWESVGGPVRYTAETRVEFDGAVRMDVTVPSGASVSRMAFEMPCRKDAAQYVHRGPVSWGGMYSAYSLPKQKETYSATRNVNTGVFYFLNDWAGLGWMDGMPFAWRLREPESAIEIVPGAHDALFRVNYIDDPKVYTLDRTFTIGMQAVPARPMPDELPRMRSYCSYMYGDEDPKRSPAWFSTAEYVSDGNVDMKQGSAEIWVKPAFDPATHNDAENFLEISHGRNHQFFLRWEPGSGITYLSDVWGAKITKKSGIDVKPGQWTHVAATWDDKAIRLFVDGKEAASDPTSLRSHMRVFPVKIYAGGNKVHVDGLRISAKPRIAFDISAPPVADADTLLCDNFEKWEWVNGRMAFIPDKGSLETEGGYFSPDMVRASGKWGEGIGPMAAPVKSLVQGVAFVGMKQMQYHSQYVDQCFAGLHIENEPAFKAGIKAAHDAGMSVMLYLSNSVSTYDPMWYAYADDWLIEPRGTPFRPDFRLDEAGYQACPRGGYFEYWLYRLGKMMDEYGHDGYFLDGRMYTTCGNARHGCGATNFEGELVPRADIWDGRIRSWKMLNVIKKRGGLWYQHDSGLRDAPTCFFADYVWDGEQFMGTTLDGRNRLDVMPLDSFRILMSGNKFGLPTTNSAYAYSPLIPIENCTYSFVHGTTWNMTYRIDEALTLWPFWKAQDEFGATLKNFRGYWYDSPPALSAPNDLVKASAHVQKGKALLMLANFNESSVSGEVKLNLKSLGLSKPRVRDAFSKAPVEVTGGDTIAVSIKGFRQAWYLLEE